MQIKRDYSRPLFGQQKQRRSYGRLLFFFGMFIGVMLVYVSANFEDLREEALDMVGLAPTPTPLPSDLATIATNLVIAGDLDEAADLFERALEQRPDSIDYMHEYGQLLIDTGDYERANTLADRILELNPAEVRGYALKSRALVWAGSPTSAIPVALTGLDISPGYAPLYSVLARAYANTGQYANGVEHGELAIQADPGDVDARRSYAYALSWVAANDQAIEQLETAMSLDPTEIDTYFELALQYLAQNRDQDAIDLYDRVLAVQPRNARAMLRLCETYRKVGQFERAIGYCEDAVNADPNYAQAYYQLGILRYNRPAAPGQLPNFQGAMEAFQACTELNPASLDCKYRLGLSYYYLDDCANAWEILQDSLVMAQGIANPGNAPDHIREGLIAIGQKCPEYGSGLPAAPTLEAPETTPEVEGS